jgi:hypothetical protein
MAKIGKRYIYLQRWQPYIFKKPHIDKRYPYTAKKAALYYQEGNLMLTGGQPYIQEGGLILPGGEESLIRSRG